MTLDIFTLGLLLIFILIHLSFIIHFFPHSIFLWNSLSYGIVNSSSLDLFKLKH